MALKNLAVSYDAEAASLRSVYVQSLPSARYGIIKKRLAYEEIGPVRLVTMVSAVEALARSVLVHWSSPTCSGIDDGYESFKRMEPVKLIRALCSLKGLDQPESQFSEDTWELFSSAVVFRNLVVHECTFLGQDKYPSMIRAAEEVLEWVVREGSVCQ